MNRCKNCGKEIDLDSEEDIFCSERCAQEYHGRTIKEGLSW